MEMAANMPAEHAIKSVKAMVNAGINELMCCTTVIIMIYLWQ
jgi:hypothetical protein